MPSILVTYGTGEGQTATVAHNLDAELTDRGFDVTTRNVWDAQEVDLSAYDGVLVGASVRGRHHQPAVVAWIERNREALAGRPTGFFQLSFASGVDREWLSAGARSWADSLIASTGWQPDHVGLFGGAVRYTQYNYLTRQAFELVSAVTTGDTDTSRDYEYTDWDEVERFADEFAAMVEARSERSVLAGITDKVVPALLVLGLAALGYWLSAERERSRQGTLGEFAEERPGSADTGVEQSSADAIDATE